MRYTTRILAVAGLTAALLVSCTENKPPQGNSEPAPKYNPFSNLPPVRTEYSSGLPNQTAQPIAQPGAGAASAGMNLTPDVTKVVEQGLEIPKDARWTIACTGLTGADRFPRMNQLQAALKARTKFKQWYVVHGENESTLYYGFYSTLERGVAEGARAHEERKHIATWVDDAGQKPFAACVFTQILPPDPPAPAEWKLGNAPRGTHWSLQIAAFKDNPQRKEAAVQYVKELREKGEEAYFHHGSAISVVCIGAYPITALKAQPLEKTRVDDVPTDDPILVVDTPLPPRMRNAIKVTDRDDKEVKVYTKHVEVINEKLLAKMKEYPHHMVNYEAVPVRGKTPDGKSVLRPSPTFLVEIPHEEVGLLNAGNRIPGPSGDMPVNNAPRMDNPTNPSNTGRLPGLRN